jgi:hypothetical protein
MKQLKTLMAAAALIGAVAASAGPALAFGGDRYYYEPSDNGSVWSFYSGYFDEEPTGQDIRPATGPDARHAHASVTVRPTRTRSTEHASGSQCWIPVFPQDQAAGMGYWGDCSTKGALPTR